MLTFSTFWMISWKMVVCALCLSIFSEFVPVKASSHRKTGYVDGDIMIGALFSMHEQPEHRRVSSGDRTCGKIWEQYGIQRMEATLKTIAAINANPRLLPNITLGVEIRDDCWYSPVALEQTIEFIRESIAAQTRTDKADASETECTLPDAGDSIPGQRRKLKKKNFVGVIGPGSSSVTIQVQNLLQLFNIPQVGYSATSPDLSDKTSYKYFLRVVPSDRYQAEVMRDLIIYHNWTYISAVSTKGSYGTSGLEAFKNHASKAGICIATEDTVPSNPNDREYERVVLNFIRYYPNAKVIACFCEGQTVTGLFNAMRKLGVSGKFLIIGSDGWADRSDVVSGVEEEAVGGISIRIQSPYIDWFDDYYFHLKPWLNDRNPWFREFWSVKFECQLMGDPNDLYGHFNRTCTGRENLKDRYKQDTKMGFVIDSIYTLAYGLHNMHRDVCNGEPGLCEEMQTINGSLLLDYLMDVNFTAVSGHALKFDENGDPPGRYDIMNFQFRDGTYNYHKVGQWDNGNLQLEQPFQWSRGNQHLKVPESVCSKPCRRGEVKAIQTGGTPCCWICTACKLNEFLLDEFTCEACPPGWLPNENLTACLPITLEYVSWDSTQAAVGLTFSCLGFLVTLFTTVVFVLHNNTTVVKASTRELSYTILVGIGLSYATTFPLVAKPTLETCYLTRILPGFSFAMIYGALVTKTNRIARILAAGKKKIMTRKPRFMSALAQVVITWMIIGIEVAILSAVLIKEPADSLLIYPEVNRANLVCNTTALGIIAPMGFDFFLIAMCTVYAIKTRNLPENFNEAKFIGFTMYTTCVIWLAFLPIYFGSDQKVLTMCLCISFSSTVALIFLFFPKLYIIILHPERNTRSAFTTTNQVRCHIGSNNLNKSMDSGSFDRHTAYRRPHTADSHGKVPSILRRFTLHRAAKTTEVVMLNSFESPTSSHENHIEVRRTKSINPRMTNVARRIGPRMSDVMEEPSTAFREPDPYTDKIEAECQTGFDLLQPYLDQLNQTTPTLRRRRKSLLHMCEEIEEELLAPDNEEPTFSGWWTKGTQSSGSKKVTAISSDASTHRDLSSSMQPLLNKQLDRTAFGSNMTLTSSQPDDAPFSSSRISLTSLGSSIQLRSLNGSDPTKDTESLRNLREWLADQGVRLTDLPTSLL